MYQLKAFEKTLRLLVSGDDGEQKDALKTLEQFPAFLGEKPIRIKSIPPPF